MEYVKKLIPVQAVQVRKDTIEEVLKFVDEGKFWVTEDYSSKAIYFEVVTIHGAVRANMGDYIIKGPQGDFYPCDQHVFIKTYRPFMNEALSFGEAIELAKEGKRIARKGWNGKGMFVVYQKGYPEGIPCNKQTAEAFGYEEGSLFKCRPYLQMRCADGSHQMWLASQSDILERDWFVV